MWAEEFIEAAVHYSDLDQAQIDTIGDDVPFGIEGFLGTSYLNSGQSKRAIEWCRTRLMCGRDTHGLTRASLVFALAVSGLGTEAMSTADGMVETAEASHNPYAVTFALLAYGLAFGNTDPLRSLTALRRDLAVARDTSNRSNEAQLAICLASVEATFGKPLAALEHITLAIRRLHDSGNSTTVRKPTPATALRTSSSPRRVPTERRAPCRISRKA